MLETSADKMLLEFDLSLSELSKSVYKVERVSLRLFVTCRGSVTRSMSIQKVSHSVDWDKQHIALDGQHPNSIMSLVRPVNAGSWIEVDVTSISTMNQGNKFVLSMDDSSAGKCEIASRETCHSSKLVVTTASI